MKNVELVTKLTQAIENGVTTTKSTEAQIQSLNTMIKQYDRQVVTLEGLIQEELDDLMLYVGMKMDKMAVLSELKDVALDRKNELRVEIDSLKKAAGK